MTSGQQKKYVQKETPKPTDAQLISMISSSSPIPIIAPRQHYTLSGCRWILRELLGHGQYGYVYQTQSQCPQQPVGGSNSDGLRNSGGRYAVKFISGVNIDRTMNEIYISTICGADAGIPVVDYWLSFSPAQQHPKQLAVMNSTTVQKMAPHTGQGFVTQVAAEARFPSQPPQNENEGGGGGAGAGDGRAKKILRTFSSPPVADYCDPNNFRSDCVINGWRYHGGVLVMEKYDFTLKMIITEYLKSYFSRLNRRVASEELMTMLDIIVEKIVHVLDLVHNHGFAHEDSHTGNFMTRLAPHQRDLLQRYSTEQNVFGPMGIGTLWKEILLNNEFRACDFGLSRKFNTGTPQQPVTPSQLVQIKKRASVTDFQILYDSLEQTVHNSIDPESIRKVQTYFNRLRRQLQR